jgi:hypothetical protein
MEYQTEPGKSIELVSNTGEKETYKVKDSTSAYVIWTRQFGGFCFVTTQSSAQRVLSLIDLTNLNDDCTEEDVVELCSRAQGEFGNTAAVCVWPRFVNLCASILRGTSIKVATVVNFPHGGTDVTNVVATTIAVLDAGADEIDLVWLWNVIEVIGK